MVSLENQKASILRMSHGVAVILFLGKSHPYFWNRWLMLVQVYAAYLTFQLYSHSHLYEDAAAGTHSRRYSKKSKRDRTNGKEPASPVFQSGTPPSEEPGVLTPPPRRSESPSSRGSSIRGIPPQDTVRIVHPSPGGSGVPMHWTETTASDVTLAENEEHPNSLGQETTPGSNGSKEADLPQLSWFMTVFIIVVVSVVRGMYTSHPGFAF